MTRRGGGFCVCGALIAEKQKSENAMTALSKEFDEKFDAIDRDSPNALETSKQLTAQHSKRLSELFGKYTIQIAPFLKDVNERERELAELFDNQKSALPSTLRPDH